MSCRSTSAAYMSQKGCLLACHCLYCFDLIHIILNLNFNYRFSGVSCGHSEFTLDYDALIVAIGAETSTFNIKGVKEYTHALKEITDAQLIRKNIINSLENASYPEHSEDEIRQLLHFVVVGGGPTGMMF